MSRRALAGPAALLAALATAGVASAAAAAPVARNGAWTGTTSQRQAITVTVKSHIVTAVSGTVTLTPDPGVAASACPPQKFSAKVNIPVSGPQRSTRAGFTFAASPYATVTGTFTSAKAMTGKLAFQSEGSPDPCSAAATFTVHSS